MEAKQMKLSDYGITVRGIINAKNKYVPKGGGDPRYTLDVAVPGLRDNIPVGVDFETHERAHVLDPFDRKVVISKFNGATFFSLES